jgi:hypothetical protein
MAQSSSHASLVQRVRLLALAALFHVLITTSALSESIIESRYQYYQEDDDRIRVDSNYFLFSIDLNDTTVLNGSLLYSAISGASPTGLPPLVKGGELPVAELEDERIAFTFGVVRQFGSHNLRAGFAYSYESDYFSTAYSVQDTISLNQKNTELVLGFAYTDDTVGANGTPLGERKRSYDAIVGINQVLSPDDLLSINLTLGWREGFLSDPYKRVLINEFFVLPDTRPDERFEQLVFAQWTHYLAPIGASVEISYRYGHNDFGSESHTAEIALYQKLFGERLIIRPAFRYYQQSAANFYDTEFTGNPRYFSSDYRLSAEETFSAGVQVRWWAIKDRFAADLGYEHYTTRGTDGKTPQESYPDAHSFTAGLHLQF